MTTPRRATFASPMIYEIRVEGAVPDSLGDYIRGLTIEKREDPSGNPESVLRGQCPDQAALHGVLDTLMSHGFAVLSMDTKPKE